MKKSVPTLNPRAPSPSSTPWSVPRGPLCHLSFAEGNLRCTWFCSRLRYPAAEGPGDLAPVVSARSASSLLLAVSASLSEWRTPRQPLSSRGARGPAAPRFSACVSAVLSFSVGQLSQRTSVSLRRLSRVQAWPIGI